MEAIFLSRPNRFTAKVRIDGMEEDQTVHVHDPGRLKEVLFPGNRVLVRKARKVGRKTAWDMIAGWVDDRWVLINSSFHRHISESILRDETLNPFGQFTSIKAEVKVGRSRLDFLIIDDEGQDLYIEVKGCSLTTNGVALFPDAPTTRGTRHVQELIDLKKKDHRSGILILILGPSASCFSPNFETDPVFSQAFVNAIEEGVEVYPVQLELIDHGLIFRGHVPICENLLSDQD